MPPRSFQPIHVIAVGIRAIFREHGELQLNPGMMIRLSS